MDTLKCYARRMPFNHYAKIKQILDKQPSGWYIRRIDQPTTAKSFKGDVRTFDHYYRIYNHNNQAIKYCKFQQIERLAAILHLPVEALPTNNSA